MATCAQHFPAAAAVSCRSLQAYLISGPNSHPRNQLILFLQKPASVPPDVHCPEGMNLHLFRASLAAFQSQRAAAKLETDRVFHELKNTLHTQWQVSNSKDRGLYLTAWCQYLFIYL